MSLFRIAPNKLEPVARTSFAVENLLERKDLQRLLRTDISPLGDDLMVVAEEYGEWEDSNRRIDLLCLSKDATLVVVEIKRTDDGGHMELQAIRYAAMVSSMTLEQVIRAHARFRGGDEQAARAAVLSFLQLESTDEAELTGEVRIVLVSADFSTEVTTAVLWLNKHDLDITCVRLRPHKLGNEVLIDATQIIPLPEAAEYEVKVRAQEQEKRKVESTHGKALRRFWDALIERGKGRTDLPDNFKTRSAGDWLCALIVCEHFKFGISLGPESWRGECSFRVARSEQATKAAFEVLLSQRAEIERNFGGPLEWSDWTNRGNARIWRTEPDTWKVPEAEWPGLQDRMLDALARIERAFCEPIARLALPDVPL